MCQIKGNDSLYMYKYVFCKKDNVEIYEDDYEGV